MFKRPYFPIVYIRGYAGTQAAVEDTVSDPYMGFNLGSTKIRQLYTQDITRHIFESPLVRLMKDGGYQDVYRHGAEIPEGTRPPVKSVWIYRYYEPVSEDLGSGKRPEIEDYARGLKKLLDDMEMRFVGSSGPSSENGSQGDSGFRVYLVAHSMGGLIARCLLQNISPDDPRVDKVFTYATPHGGIDFRWVGNVPEFLRVNNSENFNVERMREYLKLGKKQPVNALGGKFAPERVFCLVGTDHRDYGLARVAVGPMSDGLVQIANAYTKGSPRAFVHRAHSGQYGIVNSEEGYQNLRRFLFGDVRVDAFLAVEEITLPPEVKAQKEEGKQVRASYHVEVVARVRGARWDLHRRLVSEESAIFARYDDLVGGSGDGAGGRLHLASSFLAKAARVDESRKSLGFALDLGVQVPEYVVDGVWFAKNHYEGGYIFRDKVNLEAVPLRGGGWRLLYGFDSKCPNQTEPEAKRVKLGPGRYRFSIPIEQSNPPGIRATLELETSPWS